MTISIKAYHSIRPLLYRSLLIALVMFSSCATTKRTGIDLMLKQYTFAEVEQLVEQAARPIAVFLHTDWCRYCENMQQTTLRHPTVVEVLNEQYYFIPFNAEQRSAIAFNNATYNYLPNGRNTGTHELAIALGTLNGTLTYPSFVLLNEDLEITFQYNAFLSETQLLEVLTKK